MDREPPSPPSPLPPLEPITPAAYMLSPRTRRLNRALRETAARTGAIVVDLEKATGIASDPRFWSEDRLHANALGHERVAEALAHALGLPGASAAWAAALPPEPRPNRLGRAVP